MAGKRENPEDVLSKLRQVEVLQGQGATVGEAVSQISKTQQTFYRWRKLQRVLRNANTSVADIRAELRLSRARELIARGEPSISEIAARLGYTSPSNFSCAFKARMGMSPAEFRTTEIANAPTPGTST